MGKYRKILIAIDGSLSGMHALRESFRLAETEKSWMTAVTVIPPYVGDLDMTAIGNVMDAIRKPYEKALSEAKQMADEERVILRTVCEEGEPYQRIVDLADAENFDIIVMGRRGLGRMERALAGSVTARVIGYSQRDVLVVPQDTHIGWDKILVATDGSKYSMAASQSAINFAAAYGGELLIVSVVDVPIEFYGETPEAWDNLISKARGYVDSIRELASKAGVSATGLVKEGETWQAIIEVAEKQKADTIVIGSHGKTGLRRLLMGSVAEKVIGNTPCPVLVVKQ